MTGETPRLKINLSGTVNWNKLARSIILHVVNAKNYSEAFDEVRRCLTSKSLSIGKCDSCIAEREYNSLRNLFAEIAPYEDLSTSDLIHEYNAYYATVIAPRVDSPLDSSTRGNRQLFDEGNPLSFEEVIAFCVVHFLRCPRNLILFHKCAVCGRYYLSKRADPKSQVNRPRFCQKSCNDKFHNKRRIESGEHAAYLKKARANGKYQ
jgi:hypothetical protein